MTRLSLSGLLLGFVAHALAGAQTSSSSLPQVDLGYNIQQATVLHADEEYYSFNNIRYAAPPTGQNRFRAPIPPAVDRSQVFNGTAGKMCPQASPAWTTINNQFAAAYLMGMPSTITQAQMNRINASVPHPAKAATETEDCLFLDVSVPTQIFANAGKTQGAPVLVWIYGGGYTTGDKSFYNPSGLIQRSNKGIVYVALNYRLGALGWSAGPTIAKSGTPNAALYDQLAALEWVKSHISKFGGDPNRVTVIGESAGGGSITHLLTAFGGAKTLPFQQAIAQSPAWPPVTNANVMESTYNQLLKTAGVKDLAGLRALSEKDMIQANIAQVWHAIYATAAYGPTVGGDLVPDLPGKLFQQGRFHKNVRVITGHNGNEAILFTSPFVQSTSSLVSYLHSVLPTASNAVISYITNTLYPPPPYHNGTLSYKDETGRLSSLLAELAFTCNTNYIDRAYNGQGYAYYFDVPPATHGMDIAYTFFDGGMIANKTVALVLQDYITSFAKHGRPTSTHVKGLPPFQQYGSGSTVQELMMRRIGPGKDTTANPRCLWWQKALYA